MIQKKELENRRKHGYSLESAVYFLQRSIIPTKDQLLITSDRFKRNGEVRHNHMTMDDDGHVVFFVTTMRHMETVRVISLRSANEKERTLYHSLCSTLG